MKSLPQTLTETSNAIEAEVQAKYRQFARTSDLEQLVQKELSQLAQAELEIETSARREAWLKRVFANLRLCHLAQTDKPISPNSPYPQQAADVDAIDLLVGTTAWERLRAMGDGTYEQLIRRLRAMTNLEITLTTSQAEYITRFCTQHARLATNAEPNWLPLLLSIQSALQASPLVTKGSKVTIQQVSQQVVARPTQALRHPVFSLGRERVVSFSAVLGLVIVAGMIWWGGPSWQKSGQAKEVLTVTPPATQAGTVIPPSIQATPVSKPAAIGAPEQAGFYVIGVAARDEASAQMEAQTRQQQGLQPRVVYSSNWSGLTPNYYLVVYGVFTNRADTTSFRNDLEKRGIKTYMMHSGKRVQP